MTQSSLAELITRFAYYNFFSPRWILVLPFTGGVVKACNRKLEDTLGGLLLRD